MAKDREAAIRHVQQCFEKLSHHSTCKDRPSSAPATRRQRRAPPPFGSSRCGAGLGLPGGDRYAPLLDGENLSQNERWKNPTMACGAPWPGAASSGASVRHCPRRQSSLAAQRTVEHQIERAAEGPAERPTPVPAAACGAAGSNRLQRHAFERDAFNPPGALPSGFGDSSGMAAALGKGTVWETSARRSGGRAQASMATAFELEALMRRRPSSSRSRRT